LEKHSFWESWHFFASQTRAPDHLFYDPAILEFKEKGPEDFASGPSTYEFLVRLAGIEPTTPWFVAKYSIQLSYSRVGNIIKHSFRFAKFDFLNRLVGEM
jgi:hypothetical protein